MGTPEFDGERVVLEPHPQCAELAVLRIDRPPVNALSQEMWDALGQTAEQLHREDRFRAVVVTGGARHFAAGADVKELLKVTPREFDRRNRVLQAAFQRIAEAPQIVVAAINGYALGGGCELALAADFRVAGEGAVLGLPEITLGIMPGSGGTQRLARAVGAARAKGLVLTGRQVRAPEAVEIGLVDEVVPDGEVFDAAVRRALAFARGPFALRHAKRALDAALELPLAQGLALEADLIADCFRSADGQRGMAAFVAKDAAQFTGE
ncbi:enoyl-CoA hydratase/isomerase family protein [Streptomyces sp. NPDC056656]|uniref:enoyl-CoA hydratase/isomerase family protein n=1 Tax=Streptomyces sp. NPDC056656 TaxID=3345895 RepID=UPI0036CD6598